MNKSANDKIKRIIDIANGISTDDAKKIVKAIKTTKLKVQSSINGQVVKVSGSKRDTLQETIEFLKKEFPSLPLPSTTLEIKFHLRQQIAQILYFAQNLFGI